MRIFITGANGFIGSALVRKMHVLGFSIVGAVRKKTLIFPSSVEQFEIGNMSEKTDWTTGLRNVNVVIHLAARVHIMVDTAHDSLSEFRRINTEATLQLAKQAVNCGVRRFIYLSSIKVNGEFTAEGRPFTVDDKFIPTDPYALSKYEAEQQLLELSKNTSMEVVIIRAPLVYGPGVKANFSTMIKWLYKGIPLPFGSINNKRSLVSLDNLIDLLLTCVKHPAAVNEIFLVSDDDDLSTTELLESLATALGKKSRLFSVNQKVLELFFGLIGKQGYASRICGSLQVDISKTKKLLNWTPPVSVDKGLGETSKHFYKTNVCK